MAKRLDLVPFNVARRGPRRAPLVWLLLIISGVVFAASAYSVWLATYQWRDVNARMQDQRDAKIRRDADLRKAKLQRNSPLNQDRERDLRRLKELAGLSWEGLFEAIEIAANRVRGGVSLVAMVPSTVKTSMGQVRISALAANSGVMLFYIDELKKDPRITRVELSQQQPEDKLATNVVRFQLDVMWDPSIELPASKKPIPLPAAAGGGKK
jgi:hypothetical protein